MNWMQRQAVAQGQRTLPDGSSYDADARNFLRELQSQDPFCVRQMSLLATQNQPQSPYTLKDGLLAHRSATVAAGRLPYKVILPEAITDEYIRSVHEAIGHGNWKATLDRVCMFAYIPNSKVRVQEVIAKGCKCCLLTSKGNSHRQSIGSIKILSAPFEVVGLDTTGPYKLEHL